MKVQMTWVEEERVTIRYVATVTVPDEFAGWDEDTQRECLDDQRGEYDYTGLPGETVAGEVVDSEIEGWVIQPRERPADSPPGQSLLERCAARALAEGATTDVQIAAILRDEMGIAPAVDADDKPWSEQ